MCGLNLNASSFWRSEVREEGRGAGCLEEGRVGLEEFFEGLEGRRAEENSLFDSPTGWTFDEEWLLSEEAAKMCDSVPNAFRSADRMLSADSHDDQQSMLATIYRLKISE